MFLLTLCMHTLSYIYNKTQIVQDYILLDRKVLESQLITKSSKTILNARTKFFESTEAFQALLLLWLYTTSSDISLIVTDRFCCI